MVQLPTALVSSPARTQPRPEVESELRVDDIGIKFTEKSDREAFMDAVDRESDYSICTHKLFRGVYKTRYLHWHLLLAFVIHSPL